MPAETERVELAGLLHDIGKIGFPDSLFLPHEGDNPKEVVKEITRHPPPARKSSRGSSSWAGPILHPLPPRAPGRPRIPRAPEGDDIPLGARIIAVADAFDAITTDRPYQKARTYAEALAILKDGAGTKWDAECVAAFERCLPNIPVHPDAAGRRPEGCSACGTAATRTSASNPGRPAAPSGAGSSRESISPGTSG